MSLEGAIWALLAGAGAGVAHAITGPDHLAALAPLAADRGRDAWRLGLRWGVGHAAGAVLVAAAAVILRARLDLHALGGWAERIVGASLILIGIWAARRALTPWLHVHRHRHGGTEHVHVHAHRPRSAHDARRGDGSHAHGHAAAGIGFLHGAAGLSHLWAAVPALALGPAAAAVYLAGFAATSVVAMATFAGALGRLVAATPVRARRAHRASLLATAALAVAVGAWWLWGGAG